MSVERQGAVTLRGKPLTLLGPELKIGDRAPDFEVVGTDSSPVKLPDTVGKVRIFSVVTSLDTPVCDTMTRRFNKEAGSLPGVQIYTVSMDLPYAQSRWCSTAGVRNLVMLSDHRDGSFGAAYGTLVKELRLESRAVIVVDEHDTIRHVEYVKEIGDPPDYEAALEAVRALVTG